MLEKSKKIIDILSKNRSSIATMESCTGGGIVNMLTNIPKASEVIKFSAVTYCNEYKIKMGVSEKVISKYSVYSIETAREMAKVICEYAKSNYGIGVTGKLCNIDKNNVNGSNNRVYVAIYIAIEDRYEELIIDVFEEERYKNKNIIIEKTFDTLLTII